MKEMVVILVLSFIIIFVIWINYRNNKEKKKIQESKDIIDLEKVGSFPDDEDKIRKEFHLVPGQNYIMPKKFSVGMINNPKYISMNNCNHNVLYPINPIDVDYGSKRSSYCPCMQFIQAP